MTETTTSGIVSKRVPENNAEEPTSESTENITKKPDIEIVTEKTSTILLLRNMMKSENPTVRRVPSCTRCTTVVRFHCYVVISLMAEYVYYQFHKIPEKKYDAKIAYIISQ